MSEEDIFGRWLEYEDLLRDNEWDDLPARLQAHRPSPLEEEPRSKRLKMDRESNDLLTEKLGRSTGFGTKFLGEEGDAEPQSHESSAFSNLRNNNQAEKIDSLLPYKPKPLLKPGYLHPKDTNPTTITEPRPELIQPAIHGTTVFVSNSFRPGILDEFPSNPLEPSIKQLRAPSGWLSENRRRYMYDQELSKNSVLGRQLNTPAVQLHEQQFLQASKNTRHHTYTTLHQNEQQRKPHFSTFKIPPRDHLQTIQELDDIMHQNQALLHSLENPNTNLPSTSFNNQPDFFKNQSTNKINSDFSRLNTNKGHKNYQKNAAKKAMAYKKTKKK
ncbi:expressed protein [Phakopsora pachyrhizi]|uniref:Expressed protein n=1 Tax=Phakopsora pachyrhizi TaxID=170000 RepID=A0AAV0BYC3_PHAPC|nr:expressed protein [Phakopsora pachyrhizi]